MGRITLKAASSLQEALATVAGRSYDAATVLGLGTKGILYTVSRGLVLICVSACVGKEEIQVNCNTLFEKTVFRDRQRRLTPVF